MGKYIKGQEREQLTLFPTTLEDMIEEDNEVRVIDAFVESLDLEKLEIERAKPKSEGTPGYDPKDMLKIYLYGYRNKIRSSRKLMRLTKTNVEVMWLVRQITPDFRSISDFRKKNATSLKKIFLEFNLVCKDLKILDMSKVSQDGTKLRAVNAKDKNYTLNKIDDRIEHLKEQINEYLIELDKSETEEKAEKLVKVEELKARQKIYEQYRNEMEESGVNQKSLTDPESKLMKDNGSFHVCYNLQTIMSVGNHFAINYQVTGEPADFGSMEGILEEAKEMYQEKIEENITDNGYSDRKDMMNCLENGTIPQVTPERGKEEYILETEYEENEITEEELEIEEKENIKKCLRAGKVPKMYEGKVEVIEIKEVKEREYEIENNLEGLTEEEMRDKAMEEGLFLRDIKNNKVFCPGGCILRQKSRHGNGIKYCNKLGCKNCKNPCTRAAFKEAHFREGQTVLVPKNKISTGEEKLSTGKKTKKKEVIKKKVIIKLKIDKKALKRRMCTSEHNHGSMKRWDDAGYLLLKGKEKVTGEVALYYCAYNMRRAINILGVKKILEYFEEKKRKTTEEIKSLSNIFTNFVKCAIIDV